MKIAVIADIHANYPALCAVAEDLEKWNPDFVWVAGDTINRGPKPMECLAFVLQKCARDNWVYTLGNHEQYVIQRSRQDDPRSGPLYELFLPSFWTYEQINEDISAIQDLPFQDYKIFDLAGEIRVTHASILGTRSGIYPSMAERELERLVPPQSDVFCVGHTHYPLTRKLHNTLVVNTGSVGLPFDHDSRASYARLSYINAAWQAQIVRLKYDIAQAKSDYYETGFSPDSGPIARIIETELDLSIALLGSWVHLFQDAIISRQMSVAASVDKFLTGYI